MRSLIVLFIIGLCLACSQQNLVYEDRFTIDAQFWIHGDTKTFTFDAPDVDSYYDLYLNMNHESTYPFENIYLKLKTQFPDGKVVEDQLSLELFGKNGQSLCFNSTCKLQALLQPRFKFKSAGEHTIEVEQYSRQDTLPGVLDIGLSLAKVE